MNRQFVFKKDYEDTLKEMCAALKKYYSPGKALVYVGETAAHYGERTAGLEGFARVLWGLVPLWAGGGESCLDEDIPQGIAHGTDPNHPEYWGTYGDEEQAYVEMAPLAYGLLLTPERIWKPLTEEERMRFQDWLLQINSHKISDNNWLFFRVLINCGLRHVKASYSEEQIETDLNRIDEFYLGDGWYSDGVTKQRDYYIGFALHFYSLLYAKLMEREDPERCAVYKERAGQFAKSFIYWFGDRGEALPFGRSLTYRFAQGCFWSALAFTFSATQENMEEPFSWGVLRGIVSRHFRDWFTRPILDSENKLTLGYGYPNLLMCEGYNSPQSPYWAFKSFLLLAVPDVHPFWTEPEMPLPRLTPAICQPHPGMILQRGEDGYVIALASGQYAAWEPAHCAEKYGKFAYSSYFGFCIARSYYGLGQAAPDNMLAFVKDGYYHVRRSCLRMVCREASLWSQWSPMEGITVETELIPCGRGHIRTHTIYSETHCTAVECGFALPWKEKPQVMKEAGSGFSRISGPAGISRLEIREGSGKGGWIFCEANVNVLHPRVLLPYLRYEIDAGTTQLSVYVEGVPRWL